MDHVSSSLKHSFIGILISNNLVFVFKLFESSLVRYLPQSLICFALAILKFGGLSIQLCLQLLFSREVLLDLYHVLAEPLLDQKLAVTLNANFTFWLLAILFNCGARESPRFEATIDAVSQATKLAKLYILPCPIRFVFQYIIDTSCTTYTAGKFRGSYILDIKDKLSRVHLVVTLFNSEAMQSELVHVEVDGMQLSFLSEGLIRTY